MIKIKNYTNKQKKLRMFLSSLILTTSIITLSSCSNNAANNSSNTTTANTISSTGQPDTNTTSSTTSGSESNSSNETNSAENKTYKIGDNLIQNDVSIVVNKVRQDSSVQSSSDGNKVIFVEITITNNSAADLPINAETNFALYDMDEVSCNSLFIETKGIVDGVINPGNKVTGEIAYEVNKEAKEADLEVNTISNGKVDYIHLNFD